MPRFIEGVDWAQAALFPERLDGYIGEDNPVRLIEAFVDELDLEALGFQRAEPLATGRPAYHASTLLPRVRAEMSLPVLTYNMKRAMNLIGVGALIWGVRAV